MTPLSKFATASLLLALLVGGGCAAFDAAAVRSEQQRDFTNRLATAADELLAQPLTLDACLAIAMTNNYTARLADINVALQQIARNVAFTAFLPNLGLSASYQANHKAPSQAHERRYGDATLQAGVPIFMPSAWFLYAATRHGHAAATLTANYTRQQIVLETTQSFYQILVLQETVAALTSQYEAARENAARLTGLAAEGFLTAWEGEQANLLAATRQSELNSALRQLTTARNDLLLTLGLSPLSSSGSAQELTLVAPDDVETPALKELDELVLLALSGHPMLSIADRQVVIKEHDVRRAFTAFLPVINLGAATSWTANDLALHASNWLMSFGGTWQLFSGFANSARYKAAKVELQQSELEREKLFLNIMAQVIAATTAVADATELHDISRQTYQVAAAKYADYDARSREGLLPVSEALDARAAMDLGQVARFRSRYQERIALASLELAMGVTIIPGKPL